MGQQQKLNEAPDPKLLQELELFRTMELLQMMRELEMVPPPVEPEKRKKKEGKK